jgi:ribosomal protein S18 acetylase RimI-like enzyme
MKIEYRQARPSDAAACIAIRGKTRENAVSEERLRALGITVESWGQSIRCGELPGHVGLSDGEMIGYCFGSMSDGEIVVLALLPAYEGLGIGKALLNKMVNELLAAGKSRLFLGCSKDPSSRSFGFYRHLGWRSTGQFDRHGDDILAYGAPHQLAP